MAPYSIATRALIVTLKVSGKPIDEVAYLTSVLTRTINLIYARVIKRGFKLY